MTKRGRKTKGKKPAELSGAERKMPKGKPFAPGTSGNPGGVSREKREFLKALREEDSATVYEAMMSLVRALNPQAVLRAWEYIVGKPKEMIELTGKDGAALAVQNIDPTKLSKQELDAAVVVQAAIARVRGSGGQSPDEVETQSNAAPKEKP
jgi:hypothetical protein